MGVGVKLVAVRVMDVTVGLLGLRSKLNWILRPAFSNAVIGGIPEGGGMCAQETSTLTLPAYPHNSQLNH